MTIDELKKNIQAVITAKSCSAEFFFLFVDNDAMKIKTVDINEKDHEELEGIFIKAVNDTLLLSKNLSLIPLSSADDRKNAIYEYDLEKVPEELTHLKLMMESESFESFDINSDDLSCLGGMLILLGNQDIQLALYKHQYPVMLLKQDRGFSLMKPKGNNRFKKLDVDILKINSKFEFIRFNNHYYILDIKALERFFGFHEAVRNVAKKGIRNIKDANIIMNCEVFESRLDDISFARKLVKSASASPVLGKIPNKQIIEFINIHPALRGKLSHTDGEMITLKTKASQNLFLKLLNDDFLQSELTQRYYDSIAKDDLGDKGEGTE